MLTLTNQQYQIVYNAFSLTVALFAATFLFLLLVRSRVSARYRPALVVSALVVGIAAYHYQRIFSGWNEAFSFRDGVWVQDGLPFNEAYRYADWIVTVPLLLVELVVVLGLTDARERRRLLATLVPAAALMIALGYPGEIAADNGTRVLWGVLSTIPFVYILATLFFRLSRSLERQPPATRTLFDALRYVLLATWGFYPIAYMFPLFDLSGAGAEVSRQLGYTIADILAKAGYGLIIYVIALRKTEAEGPEPELAPVGERLVAG